MIRKSLFILALAGFAASLTPAAASAATDGPAFTTKDPEGVDLPSWGRKKKEDDKHPGPAGGAGPHKQEEPPFDEVIKDAEKIDGLFTLYKKDDRYLLALKPDQLDKDYMASVTRETGIGESLLLAAQVMFMRQYLLN